MPTFITMTSPWLFSIVDTETRCCCLCLWSSGKLKVIWQREMRCNRDSQQYQSNLQLSLVDWSTRINLACEPLLTSSYHRFHKIIEKSVVLKMPVKPLSYFMPSKHCDFSVTEIVNRNLCYIHCVSVCGLVASYVETNISSLVIG